MLVLLITTLLLGLLTTVSLLISYYVTIMMNQSTSNNDPSVNNSIMTQTTILVQNVTNAIGDLASLITSKTFDFIANIQQNFKMYLNLFIFFSLFLTYLSNKESFLSQIDKFWRCGIHPLFRNVIFVILQLLRLFWGAIAPIYNYEVLIVNQIFTSSKIMYFKCNLAAIFDSIKIILNILLVSFKSIASWAGAASGELSIHNNPVTNELNVVQVVMNIQRLVLKQSQVTGCICEGFNEIFEFIYIVFRQDELAYTVNYAINFPLSLLQMGIQMTPPWSKFPMFIKPMNNLLGFVYYGGRYLDEVFMKWIVQIISLFDDNFKIQGLPEEFFFTIGSRYIMAGIHLAYMGIRIIKTLAIPIGPALISSDYMIQVFTYDKVYEQIVLAIRGTTDLLSWFLKVQHVLTTAIGGFVSGKDTVIALPSHTHIICDLETATSWYEQQACATRLIAEFPFDFGYGIYTLTIEILWKILVFQEESIIQTLQRYDGPSYPRSKELTCEYRDSITYDLTSGECGCDPGWGVYHPLEETVEHPFGKPYYDPHCKQWNLQVNYFGKMERIEHYLASGWYENWAEILNIFTLTQYETQRMTIKAILNIESIISGDYFMYKTNCGYGLSSKQLRTWWDETNTRRTLKQQIESAQTQTCKGASMTYFDSIKGVTKCVLIDTAIKNLMCADTANPSGIINTQSVVRCRGTNKAGCECNWALGTIDYNNKCKCIRGFPDAIMENAQGPFENKVLTAFYRDDIAVHWCNTHWADWLLFYIDKYANVVENAFAVFHPSYETAADGTNAFCKEKSFTVFETTILSYPLWRYRQNKDIFQSLQLDYDARSCDVYGTTDMICSTGMTVRNAVRLVVNEIRVLVIAISRLLEGDFTAVQITFSERLCDLARTIAGLSSILPAILPDGYIDKKFQQGVSQFIFANFYLILALLDTVNHVLVFVQDLITGNLDWSTGPAGPFFQLIFGIINVWIDTLRLLLQSEGNMLNGILNGAGDAMFQIDNIIDIVQKYLINEATFEIIGLITKIGMSIIQFFTGGGASVEGFFTDLFTLIKKFWDMIMQQSAKIMTMILEAIGPAFTEIRTFIQGICGTIEDVICVITLGESCDMGCRRHHNRRHLFSSGNHTAPFQDATRHIVDKMDWSGTSSCDMFVHSYKDYKFDDLRPLEQIQLHECVDQRMTIIEMNKRMNISLPEDLIYNWKRKWMLGYKAVEGAIIVYKHKSGKMSAKEMIRELKAKGIDYHNVLPYYNLLSKSIRTFFTMGNFHKTMELLLKPETPKEEKSSLGHIYRLYHIGKRASNDIYKHTPKMKHNLNRALNTIYHHQLPKKGINIPNIPTHLRHAYDSWAQLRTTPVSLSKKNGRRFVLRAAGVVTDTSPCEEKEDSYVCINCAILDNLLNVAIRDGIRMSQFYQNVYSSVTIPDFVRFWTNNTETQAWNEDMGKMMGTAMDNIGNDISDLKEQLSNVEIPTPPPGEIDIDIYLQTPGFEYYEEDGSTRLEHKRKLYSNKTYTNQSISFYLRAKNDWIWFFKKGWNPFVNRTNETDARPPVTTVLADFISQPQDTYVPYFAYSILHYIVKPFDTCPMDKMYCAFNTFEDRQRLIIDAFYYMFIFTLVIIGIQYQFALPIATVLASSILLIYFLIYMYTVYEYTLYCFPSVPNCWADDFYAFVHDKLFPSCFCYYLPGLSKTCNPDTCFLCSRVTEFSTCIDTAPQYKSMGILWSTFFLIRKNYPGLLLFVYKTIPFAWIVRSYQPLVEMTQLIMEGVEIEQIEIDCLNISYIDIALMAIVLYIILRILSVVAPAMVRVAQHTTNIVTIYITIIYSMALSLEIQTTALKD